MRLRTLGMTAGVACLLAAGLADAKTLRLNIEADPAMIDPVTYSELVSGNILRNVYEGFTRLDKDGNITPGLALRWEADADNMGWRFHLRPNVKFHSGKTFGAKDVKYTFEQLLIPANKGGLALEYVSKIVGAKDIRDGKTTELMGVKVVNDLTVEVRFTEPDVLFPIYQYFFFDSETVKEKGMAAMQTGSAGTGPYSIVHWRRGQEVLTKAHKDYWGGAPKVDGVQFLIVPSEETAINQYQAGDLDVVWMQQPEVSRRALRDPKLKAESATAAAAQINFLGMNQNLYAPFKDKRVREAFCIAIDRDGMSTGLFGGLAEPLYGQITPGVAGYNKDVKKIAFDAARAKRLLAEAGFPDAKGMPPLTITAIPTNRTESTYLADQYRQVLGLNVEVNVIERGTFIRAMNAGEVAFFHWGWTAGWPDAMYYLQQVWYSTSPYNRARYKNADYDKAIDEAAKTPNNDARYKLYHKAEQILMDDWGSCGTYVRTQVALIKPNVKGVVVTPYRLWPFYEAVVN